MKPIVENGLALPEGIAVDWVTRHIYWIESQLDQIEVSEFDGSNRACLLSGGLANPRAIVVDPRVG